jgi:putative heme iron utilization protein
LERDHRASLLVAEGGSADPLANGRITLLGPCRRVRLAFAKPVSTPEEARAALISMVKDARSKLG